MLHATKGQPFGKLTVLSRVEGRPMSIVFQVFLFFTTESQRTQRWNWGKAY